MFLEYHQTKKSLFITTFHLSLRFTSKLSIAGFIKAILTMIKKFIVLYSIIIRLKTGSIYCISFL